VLLSREERMLAAIPLTILKNNNIVDKVIEKMPSSVVEVP